MKAGREQDRTGSDPERTLQKQNIQHCQYSLTEIVTDGPNSNIPRICNCIVGGYSTVT